LTPKPPHRFPTAPPSSPVRQATAAGNAAAGSRLATFAKLGAETQRKSAQAPVGITADTQVGPAPRSTPSA